MLLKQLSIRKRNCIHPLQRVIISLCKPIAWTNFCTLKRSDIRRVRHMWPNTQIDKISHNIKSTTSSFLYFWLNQLYLKGIMLKYFQRVLLANWYSNKWMFRLCYLLGMFFNDRIVILVEDSFSHITVIEESVIQRWAVAQMTTEFFF